MSAGKAREKQSRTAGHNTWRDLSRSDDSLQGARSPLKLLRENPSAEWYHPCTLDDYVDLLSRLPATLATSLRAIILRRTSKRDQALQVEASRRAGCIVMNSFPKSGLMAFGRAAPGAVAERHYAPWCSRWVRRGDEWFLQWKPEEIRRYYLYHLFLHELGHINDAKPRARKRREDFAEQFALRWARTMGEWA